MNDKYLGVDMGHFKLEKKVDEGYFLVRKNYCLRENENYTLPFYGIHKNSEGSTLSERVELEMIFNEAKTTYLSKVYAEDEYLGRTRVMDNSRI
jgi:hypothetical protein